MYWLKEFDESVTLPPEFLVPGVADLVQYRIRQKLEGTCSPQHGYVLAILSAAPKSPGNVQPGVGSVRFEVRCRALIAYPIRNQVLDVTVGNVTKVGFFGMAGPVQVFVSNKLLAKEYRYEATSIPPCYRADELGLRIGAGDKVRVRVIGSKIENNDIFAIGTIKEDYLGPITSM
jgi:DNA-directed RNA polymerase II subunit RPB7